MVNSFRVSRCWLAKLSVIAEDEQNVVRGLRLMQIVITLFRRKALLGSLNSLKVLCNSILTASGMIMFPSRDEDVEPFSS